MIVILQGVLLGVLYGIVGFGLMDWQFWVLVVSVPFIMSLDELAAQINNK